MIQKPDIVDVYARKDSPVIKIKVIKTHLSEWIAFNIHGDLVNFQYNESIIAKDRYSSINPDIEKAVINRLADIHKLYHHMLPIISKITSDANVGIGQNIVNLVAKINNKH